MCADTSNGKSICPVSAKIFNYFFKIHSGFEILIPKRVTWVPLSSKKIMEGGSKLELIASMTLLDALWDT